MSAQDYAELFKNENVGRIDFSQFLSIMVFSCIYLLFFNLFFAIM